MAALSGLAIAFLVVVTVVVDGRCVMRNPGESAMAKTTDLPHGVVLRGALRPGYDKVLTAMQAERPIVYLFYLPWTFGVQKKLTGFVPYPDGLIRLKGVSIAKKQVG